MSATVQSPQDVLERVRKLVPVLRERALKSEQVRDALPENVAMLEEAGVYRMTLAKDRGGFEANLDQCFDVLYEIARGDPSMGWVAGIHMDGIWQAGKHSDELQDELFSEPNAKMCGVITSAGRGVREKDGLRISGRWDFNTGWRFASWLFMLVMVEGEAGPPEPCVCVMPRSDTQSLNNWNTMGMAGTGSHTTVAENVFVPAHRIMSMADAVGGFRSQRNRENPYYQLSVAQYVTVSLSGTHVGIARGAMDLFLERLPGRKITITDYTEQREAPLTHMQVASAELNIQSAVMFARAANAHVEAFRGKPMSMEERVRPRAHIGQLVALSRAAVQTLFEASGASAIRRDLPIQRHFRDISAIALHSVYQPTTAAELYGRVLVGLPPNTFFL